MGKPVIITNEMPSISVGAKAVAFITVSEQWNFRARKKRHSR